MPGLKRRVGAVAVLAVACAAARAHVDGAEGAILAWSFDPLVLGCLLASALGYAAGVRRLWRHAGRGRGVSRAQAGAFAAGWLTLVVALVSPLDSLGVRSFAAHMVQHELMMVVAAPLLCLARPLAAWTWALPPPWRRGAGRLTRHPAWAVPWSAITAPLGAWLLHAAALWIWHLPTLFDAALRDDTLHTLQHTSFLAGALLLWWSVLAPSARSPRGSGAAVASLFGTMLHTGALGALLAFSPQPWYAAYADAAPAFGIAPLDDQQLGGLIMWVPGGLAYMAAALVVAGRWLRAAPA